MSKEGPDRDRSRSPLSKRVGNSVSSDRERWCRICKKHRLWLDDSHQQCFRCRSRTHKCDLCKDMGKEAAKAWKDYVGWTPSEAVSRSGRSSSGDDVRRQNKKSTFSSGSLQSAHPDVSEVPSRTQPEVSGVSGSSASAIGTQHAAAARSNPDNVHHHSTVGKDTANVEQGDGPPQYVSVGDFKAFEARMTALLMSQAPGQAHPHVAPTNSRSLQVESEDEDSGAESQVSSWRYKGKRAKSSESLADVVSISPMDSVSNIEGPTMPAKRRRVAPSPDRHNRSASVGKSQELESACSDRGSEADSEFPEATTPAELAMTEQYFSIVQEAISRLSIDDGSVEPETKVTFKSSRLKTKKAAALLPMSKEHKEIIDKIWQAKNVSKNKQYKKAVADRYKIAESDYNQYLQTSLIDRELEHELRRSHTKFQKDKPKLPKEWAPVDQHLHKVEKAAALGIATAVSQSWLLHFVDFLVERLDASLKQILGDKFEELQSDLEIEKIQTTLILAQDAAMDQLDLQAREAAQAKWLRREVWVAPTDWFEHIKNKISALPVLGNGLMCGSELGKLLHDYKKSDKDLAATEKSSSDKQTSKFQKPKPSPSPTQNPGNRSGSFNAKSGTGFGKFAPKGSNSAFKSKGGSSWSKGGSRGGRRPDSSGSGMSGSRSGQGPSKPFSG